MLTIYYLTCEIDSRIVHTKTSCISGSKFLKKLCCCIGGEYDKIILFYQPGWAMWIGQENCMHIMLHVKPDESKTSNMQRKDNKKFYPIFSQKT